ncbi:MAG: hypothetical protein ACP5I1_02545 [Candidatus Hinthialibacter sp.]
MMYHKNGLFFAVISVVGLMLITTIAPIPVSAQSDSAARVAIDGPEEEFGDVLLVKDGDDIIISGLAGAVSGSGAVTISADGMTPITENASFLGHFPVKTGNPIRVPGGTNLESAEITFVKSGSGETVSGSIPLNITGDNVVQALRDYSAEVDKVLKGEKTTIDKGMPPHILLDIVLTENETEAEAPVVDPSLVGKVLLTQRLVIKKSGDSVSLSLVDQFEGIAGAGLTPPIQSFPNFSKVGVYGEKPDLDNPDITKRVHLLDTVSFVDGSFVSNGYFFPFSIPDVNSFNIEEIKQGLEDVGIVTPQIADVLYLRVVPEDGPPFLAQINNDVSAGIEGELTVITNNENNAAGPDALAVIEGFADPYALITAYADDSADPEWIASDFADATGFFSIAIPSTAEFDEEKGEFGVYLPRNVVYLSVGDPFANESESLYEVATDSEAVITETPVATPQADGTMLVTGRTEAGAVVFVDGRTKDGSEFYFAGVDKADADGVYEITSLPYYEYNVTVVDQAGNTISILVAGDQSADAPSNLTAQLQFPSIRITGMAEPNSSIITFGFNAGVVPDNPVVSDTLPEGAFFLGGSNLEFPETTAKADSTGAFTLYVPSSVGRYIYLQAVDPAGNSSQFVPFELVDENGNLLGDALVTINVTSVTNNPPGIDDVLHGVVLDPGTETPIAGVLNNIVIAGFASVTSETAAAIPFVDQLSEFVQVNSDGTFSLAVSDRSEATNKFITEFYVVAFMQFDDGTLRDIGFKFVSTTDGFDRIGPRITFAPLATDFVIRELGDEGSDMMNINRIYPAGAGAGMADLPSGSLPYVFILADGNDDEDIDVNSPDTYIVDWKPLNSAIPGSLLPLPGVTGLDLGVNYWDASMQSVVGNSVVFVSLIDAVGNFSPNPIPVHLDVFVQDPDASDIAASGAAIFANEGAVEANSKVSVFETVNKTGLIGTTTAYSNGGFALTDLSISEEYVYILSKDEAGNESNLIQVKVSDPVQGSQYMVLDEFGLVHTPGAMLGAAGEIARAISKVNDVVYALYADGSIVRLSGMGALPADDELVLVKDDMARDIEVISENPFQAYVLLGNGLVLTYGDVPFLGDLGNPDPSIPRVTLPDGTMFKDLNGNGVRDTEDVNGNGVLDISVGIGGVLETEDTGIEGIEGSAGNGILDQEPLINLDLVEQGFGFDIARDLELVQDDSGAVKGYVILDGLGVLWSFGSDIDEQNVRPNATNGVVQRDEFKDLELIVEDGKIVDFITMNGRGELFALPSDQGGVLGAGPSTDPEVPGVLSADQYGLTLFGFDIARDVEISQTDSNGDGSIDWQDGFYILDGFGGIHAVGGAEDLEANLFLGLDIARDLEF